MYLNNTKYLLIAGCLLFGITTFAYATSTKTANSILQLKPSEPYKSYLTKDSIANSLALLPPPPQQNSPAFQADEAAYKQGHNYIHTPRWQLAQNDANLADTNIGKPFSQALGITISKQNTPQTYSLLRHVMVDSGFLGTDLAKNHYQRIRPFVYYHTQTCWPQDDKLLRKDGSYPSGHSAFGWSTALILAEMFPEKQNQILQRGYDFGQSRVICGAHWQSDVDAGRIIGAEIVSRLHTNKEFMQDFLKSKTELSQKISK